MSKKDLSKRLTEELFQKSWTDRIGHCYELAFKFVVAHPEYRLCHGKFPNDVGGHAWAEDEEGNIVDLTQPNPFIERWRFLEVLDVELEFDYDARTAMELAVKTKHFGLWHESEPDREVS